MNELQQASADESRQWAPESTPLGGERDCSPNRCGYFRPSMNRSCDDTPSYRIEWTLGESFACEIHTAEARTRYGAEIRRVESYVPAQP